MNVIKLTEKLISIPSFVEKDKNEREMADFIWKYLEENLPWMKMEKQLIENDRYNIIATDGVEPKLIFVCHVDTVKASKLEMLEPETKEGKIYGLGACDMKGGLASVIEAVRKMKRTKGLMLIFDCDEEYYFKGIKKIFKKYELKPKLVVCPEPTDLKIINGCRGLIEIQFEVIGKTAHAGRPQDGVNAIEKAIFLIEKFKKDFRENDIPELGQTTVNLSSLQGGRRDKNGKVTVQANAVADIASVLLDIRPADPKLDAEIVIEKLNFLAVSEEVQITNENATLNYKPYISDPEKLKEFEKALSENGLKVAYQKDLGQGGFYESALISNAWNCPAINFGPTEKKTAHTEDEYVEIKSLIKMQEVFENLIKKYCCF